MIKILIVEDNSEKLKNISEVLTSVEGVDIEGIEYTHDVNNAKKWLKNNNYDLMILDIAIPGRIDGEIDRYGGIKILNDIFNRREYKIPAHIVGITGYPDIYDETLKLFSTRSLTIIKYDSSSDEWEIPLKARVKHILISKTQKEEEGKFQSHLAIICALESPELSNVKSIEWNWKQIHVVNDETIYYKGEITNDNSRRTVYAAAASRMGMPAASILSMKMITSFRPEYIAIVGITAGVPGRTKFGDIISADPSWDYGSGKWQLIEDKLTFRPSPHQLHLNIGLRNKLKDFATDFTTLNAIKHSWPGEKPDHELRLLVGPLASGASVLADGNTFRMVQLQHRDLLGIEMETYGIFAAAEEVSAPRPSVFSLKAVVDFANGEKDDKYQKYGAFVSAQTLKHFVEKYL